MTTGQSSGRRSQRADHLELVLGALLGVDAVDADLAPDRLGDRARSPETIATCRIPVVAQALDESVGVRAQLVGHHDHAGESAVDADEHLARPPVPPTGRARSRRLGRRDSRPEPGTAAADGDAAAVDGARDALARLLAHVRRRCSSRRPRLSAVVHERLAEDVGRELVDRRGEPQQLARLDAVQAGRSARPPGVPTVSVPVLSNRTVRARRASRSRRRP